MATITNFDEAHAALEPYLHNINKSSQAYTLDRMRLLLQAFDNPQDKLKIIHVAGTSGKTSTCYYITSLLKTSGATVGLTVSPYVDQINERIQVNLRPLDESVYCAALQEFLKAVKAIEYVKPTYFEILIAFAYWYFAKMKVDYAVIEVGIGGLSDCTNVADRADKVCVITDIGLDHQDVLGNTLAEISAQKAGIIKASNLVLCHRQAGDIYKVISAACASMQASLRLCESGKRIPFSETMPLYQQRNWQLAHETYVALAKRDNLVGLNSDQLLKSQTTYIPGRLEKITYKGKTIILDGAHNVQKIATLVESLKYLAGDQPVAVLFSCKASKDQLAMVKLLGAVSSYTVTCKLPINEPVASSGAEANEADYDKALETILERSEQIILVTGSIYLLHAVRGLIKD